MSYAIFFSAIPAALFAAAVAVACAGSSGVSDPPMPTYDVADRCAPQADPNLCVSLQYLARRQVTEEWLAVSPAARAECIAVSRWQDYTTLHNCLDAHKLDAQITNAPTGPTAYPSAPQNSVQLDDTLEKLRKISKKSQAAKTLPLPPTSAKVSVPISTGGLTADQRGAISEHVRECWTKDPRPALPPTRPQDVRNEVRQERVLLGSKPNKALAESLG